jgi:hypothetical protein
MVKQEPVRIITNTILRDARTERRIIELNRLRAYYSLLLAGGVCLLISILWFKGVV